jgi:hypothetical protein
MAAAVTPSMTAIIVVNYTNHSHYFKTPLITSATLLSSNSSPHISKAPPPSSHVSISKHAITLAAAADFLTVAAIPAVVMTEIGPFPDFVAGKSALSHYRYS